MSTEIRSSGHLVGYFKEIALEKEDSMLVIQLPRKTKDLSNGYIDEIKRFVKSVNTTERPVLIIGADVNIYELAAEEAVSLKLKGIIN